MEAGTVLIAVGAKTEESYSHAYSQLLTYLVIIRKLHQQNGGAYVGVQSFYSDGQRFCFVRINWKGQVLVSKTLGVRFSDELSTVFNWQC